MTEDFSAGKARENINVSDFQNYFLWCVSCTLIFGLINTWNHRREVKEPHWYSMRHRVSLCLKQEYPYITTSAVTSLADAL